MSGPGDTAPALAIGSLFAERYQIEEAIGRGGMGEVYRARDCAVGEAIALKILAPALSQSPPALLRFRDEVRLSRRVTHPNVARVYDLGEHEGAVYLTMEFVPGVTLRSLVKRGTRLPVHRAVEIGRALAQGIAAAHAAGVIHRDLKPSNVLDGARRARGDHRLRHRALSRPKTPTSRWASSARRATWRRSRPRAGSSTRAPICTPSG